MNRALIRLTVAVAASCGLLVGGLTLQADAVVRTPPVPNVIVIPSDADVLHEAQPLVHPFLPGALAGITDGIRATAAKAGAPQTAAMAPGLALLVFGPAMATVAFGAPMPQPR